LNPKNDNTKDYNCAVFPNQAGMSTHALNMTSGRSVAKGIRTRPIQNTGEENTMNAIPWISAPSGIIRYTKL